MSEGIGLVPQPKRVEVERMILTCFPCCPFCKTKGEMEFTWGHLVPKTMTCRNCGASWEPFLSYDGTWGFIAAKLVSESSNTKRTDLLNKLYSNDFWKKMCLSESFEEEKEIGSKEPTKTVIIREIVKVRCPYCGGLYDEVDNRCPYCSGKR